MIGRRTLLPMANVVVGAILGLVALKVVAVYLGREPYGELEAALAFLGIVYIFADLSMGEAHVKRVSQGMHPGDCFATFAVFRLVSGLAFIAVATTLYFVFTQVLGRTLEDTTPVALAIVMFFYVMKSAQNVAQSTFDARLEMARSQLGSFLETVVRATLTLLVAGVFAALVHKGGPLFERVDPDFAAWRWVAENPAGALAFTYLAGTFVATAVTLVYLMRVLERGRFRWSIMRSYFAFALPLFAASAMGLVSLFIDRASLALFGTALDTANFGGPRRIVSVIEGLGAALGLVLFPAISAMASRGDGNEMHRVVDKSLRFLGLFLVPTVAFLVVFPRPIISLALGDDWLVAAPVLSILSLWVLVHVLSRPQGNLILGTGHASVAARIGIITSVLNIVLNLILIPDDIKSLGIPLAGLKARGAAIATLVSSLVAFYLIHRAAKSLTGYTPKVAVWKPVVASVLMCGALLALDAYSGFPLHRWYTIPPYVVVGATVYAAGLLALGEITREDVRYFRDTVAPTEMWRYVRGELGRRGKP